MKQRANRSQIVVSKNDRTPIGQLSIAGRLHKDDRSDFKTMRVLGSYAIVYLFQGSGFYQDANGVKRNLKAGDLILILPEIAHRYGPRRGEAWSEIYVVFHGPAFDLWREQGVLSATRPITQLTPVDFWLSRIESTLAEHDAGAPADTVAQPMQTVSAFLHLLTEMFAPNCSAAATVHEEPWVALARRRLEENLSAPIDMHAVAKEAGLSYESFRKRFAKEVGVPPARYRTERRIAAAQTLITQSNLTLRAVATNLGFSDEFHFSRRFKEITGMTPRECRLTR